MKPMVSFQDGVCYDAAEDAVRSVLGKCVSMPMLASSAERSWRNRPVVAIKPNLVLGRVNNDELFGDKLLATVTHPSLIEAVYRFFHERGCDVVVAEAPLSSTNLPDVARRIGLTMPVTDLRAYIDEPRWWSIGKLSAALWRRREMQGDPLGYSVFDAPSGDWVSADARFHNSERRDKNLGTYSISNTILKSDLVVAIPKVKTHIKAGFTAARKLFVGACGRKDWLPHYTVGVDKVPVGTPWHHTARGHLSRFPIPFTPYSAGIRVGRRKPVDFGAVPGNTTTPRMVDDINAILDDHGPPIFCIADSIVCGHRYGPLDCDPLPTGRLIWGWDRVAVDAVCVNTLAEFGAEFPVGWGDWLRQNGVIQ